MIFISSSFFIINKYGGDYHYQMLISKQIYLKICIYLLIYDVICKNKDKIRSCDLLQETDPIFSVNSSRRLAFAVNPSLDKVSSRAVRVSFMFSTLALLPI